MSLRKTLNMILIIFLSSLHSTIITEAQFESIIKSSLQYLTSTNLPQQATLLW